MYIEAKEIGIEIYKSLVEKVMNRFIVPSEKNTINTSYLVSGLGYIKSSQPQIEPIKLIKG